MAIKPKYVKQLGRTLLEDYPEAFNTDFETNKEHAAEKHDLTLSDSEARDMIEQVS